MRDIGLHLRLTDSLIGLARKAQALELPIFQCFFLHQESMRPVRPSHEEVAEFARIREQFKQLIVHSSYWTNLASMEPVSMRMIKHELNVAKRLHFNQLVIHPGCTKGIARREDGIDMLVSRLNEMLKYEHDVQLVLENTAHGKHSIGSNLDDFKLILQKIDKPEKIAFCIDTAHAHAYGYALNTADDRNQFFTKLADTIGFERIALLHVNNTHGDAGSCLDRHALLDKGSITLDALQAFVLHPAIAQVPMIMELPAVDQTTEIDQIRLVRDWHTERMFGL